jgi:hypothetical protein
MIGSCLWKIYQTSRRVLGCSLAEVLDQPEAHARDEAIYSPSLACEEIASVIVTRSVSEGSVPHLRFGL